MSCFALFFHRLYAFCFSLPKNEIKLQPWENWKVHLDSDHGTLECVHGARLTQLTISRFVSLENFHADIYQNTVFRQFIVQK